MDESKTRAALLQHFGDALRNEDAMKECLSISRLYSMPPDELYYKWEAYVINSETSAAPPPGGRAREPLKINVDNLRELKKVIQADVQAAGKGFGGAEADGTPRLGGGSAGLGTKRRQGRMGEGIEGLLGGIAPQTPLAKRAAANGRATPGTIKARPPPSALGGMATPTALSCTNFRTPARPAPAFGSSPSGSNGFPTPTAGSGKFHTRTNAGELAESLNAHLEPAPAPANPGPKSRVALSSASDIKLYGYRYMFEKISERSEVLDDLIDSFAHVVRQHYGISDLADPGAATSEPVLCVGRICSDAESAKLSESSVILESSRMMGSGIRIPLRFAPDCVVRGGAPGAEGVGLFPGQIVGVRGKNGGGGWFGVDEVFMMPPLPLAATPASDLLDLQYDSDRLAGSPFSVMVASGPYTLDSDLEYAPLNAVLSEVRVQQPDVLLLLGPFVDASHPLIKAGDVDQTPSEIFRTRVGRRLAETLDSARGTTAILIPSVRDLISAHIAFPQSHLQRDEELGLPPQKRCKLLPNPAVFSINEVVFGVSTVDVLFHLRKEEFFKKAAEAEPSSEPAPLKDSMAMLCRHVLGQRSFYPIFPAPKESAPDVNLDLTHQHLLKFAGDVVPDVLILPSMLKHFAKVVDSTLVINPGFSTKAQSAGTFAKISVHAMDRAGLEVVEGEHVEHRVWDRARVDLVRV